MMGRGPMFHTDTENKKNINTVKWHIQMLKEQIGRVDP
jgi:hypothetical protein